MNEKILSIIKIKKATWLIEVNMKRLKYSNIEEPRALEENHLSKQPTYVVTNIVFCYEDSHQQEKTYEKQDFIK